LLKTALDQSVNAGFSEVAQKARAAQGEIQRATKQTADQEAKLRRERIRDFEREQSEMNRARKQQLSEEERDRKDALRAAAAASKERQRMARETAQVEAREARAAAKAQQSAVNEQMKIERTAQQTSQSFNQSLVRLAASRQGILLGSIHVARGLALLFSSNEKQAQKLMQNLMMIQGAYDVLKGATHIVHGLNSAYAAYTAAVAAAAAAQTASATAAANAARAHAEDAVAAEADAIANSHLAGSAGASAAAQGGARLGGMQRLMGGAMGLGARGLAGLGGMVGGGAMAGVGVGAAIVGVPAAFYHFATAGAKNDAALSERRTSLMEGGFHERMKAQEEGERNEDRIQQVERERREGRAGIERGVFQRGMGREERLRELRGPNIGSMMSGWSASMEGGGRREPGAAGYQKVEEAIAADRATGTGLTAKYEAEAAKAAQDVAAKRKAQEEAEAEAKRFREASAMSQVGATGAVMRAEENKSKWVTGTNWIHRTGSWMASWYRDNQQTEQARLEEKAAGAQTGAKGIAEVAGGRESEAKAAQVATEDALKRQQEITEKIAADKEAQAQRDIKNAEAYIAKLKEMHEAHLRNADAIEKAGRALTVQLALSKPDERRRLMRAMQHSQAGRASDKELGLLARNAAPEQAEQFEKQIEGRHPEYSGLREFLGKGKSAVEAEKAKAADEEKRIKQQEEYLGKAREAAVKSADTMSNRLANVLKELFDTQERRFVEAIERMRVDFATRDRGSKALAE
jgi:hypothetical protein